MKYFLALPMVISGLVCVAGCTSDDLETDEPDAATELPDAAGELPDAATEVPESDAATEVPESDAATELPDAATEVPESDAAGELPDAATEVPESDAATELPDAATEEPEGDAASEAPETDAATELADGGAGDAGDPFTPLQELGTKYVLDLVDVKTNPEDYDWFDFRPNVLKLILSGAAETEHVAILWYTVTDGAVGLHYHAKTESVYVIDGTQTDAKGVYPTGTVYFNPPGSGHEISDSSGFFILAYAAPPDFMSTDLIEEYSPVRIDTQAEDFMTEYPFESQGEGISTFEVPLDGEGGLAGEFIEITSSEAEYEFVGNYVLVLEGSCDIEGETFGAETLVVAKDVAPEAFSVTASEGSSCFAMAVSF